MNEVELFIFLALIYYFREPLGKFSAGLGEIGKALVSLGCIVAALAILMSLAGGAGLLLGG